MQASKPGYSATISSKRTSSWSTPRKSSSTGGLGSWVSMIDSTWLTPIEQCCDSSGMPQMVILCVGRGIARSLKQAPRHVQPDGEHADQEDPAEGLGRDRLAGLLAEPDAGEGRHDG